MERKRMPASDTAGPPPIFIIGNPRSGTTLLRLILTCHPRIVIPPECGFLIDLKPRHGDFRNGPGELDRFVDDLVVTAKFEHWKLPVSALRVFLHDARPADYASLAASVYAFYASVHQSGKTHWGDKNNFYLAHIGAIASLFPCAVFLHIVRDGRDVTCSYRSLAHVKGKYAPVLPSDLFDAMYEWGRNLKRIRRAFGKIGWHRVYELRYEDLVHDPEAVLKNLCGFLGEDYSPLMLAYDRENRERELEPREFDAWKNRNRTAIDASAVGRWKAELPRAEAALMQLTAGAMLRRYRYDTAQGVHPGVALRLAVRLVDYHARRARRRLRRLVTRAASFCA